MNKYVRMMCDRIVASINQPPRTANDAAQEDMEFLQKQVRSEALRLDGDECPTCGSHVSYIKVTISNSMVRYLRALVNSYDESPRFYHHRELFEAGEKASTNGTRLVHWGLIERSKDKGYYKPTEDGIAFINGDLPVPRYVILFNNEPVEYAERLVHIGECVNSRRWEV